MLRQPFTAHLQPQLTNPSSIEICVRFQNGKGALQAIEERVLASAVSADNQQQRRLLRKLKQTQSSRKWVGRASSTHCVSLHCTVYACVYVCVLGGVGVCDLKSIQNDDLMCRRIVLLRRVAHSSTQAVEWIGGLLAVVKLTLSRGFHDWDQHNPHSSTRTRSMPP